MRLYRRGKGQNWTLDVRFRGRRYVVSSKTTSQKRANAWARDFIAELEAGSYRPDKESIRFERLVDLARNHYRVNNRRSLNTFDCVVKRLAKHFAQVRAVDITSERIERYKANRLGEGPSRKAHGQRSEAERPVADGSSLRKAPANSTINHELAALSLMFRLAEWHQLVSRPPRIHYLDERDAVRQGFVSQGEYFAIRAGLPERLADLTDFLWSTGLRLGTGRSLEWRDVQEHTIRIRSETVKTNRAHELPITGQIAAIIYRAARYRTPITPLVFHRNRRPLLNRWCERHWQLAGEKVGLGHILIHDLRRSFVRNMRLAGLPEAVIMRFTGHSTRKVFDRYSIVSIEEQSAALERMEEFLSEQSREPSVRRIK